MSHLLRLFIFWSITVAVLLLALGGLAFSLTILYKLFFCNSIGQVHTRYALLNAIWTLFAQASVCGITFYALTISAGCLYVMVEIIKMLFFDKNNS